MSVYSSGSDQLNRSLSCLLHSLISNVGVPLANKMAPATYYCLVLVISFILSFADFQSDPCPFNSDCTCQPGHGTWQYKSISCGPNIDGMPRFDQPDGSLSAAFVIILGDVSRIESNAFAAFKSINALNLVQTKDGNEVNWDESAFDGVEITFSFSVSNLPGLLPIPEAVKALGRNGLPRLRIINSQAGGVLQANAFSDFKNLKEITIENTPISSIDDDAFAGLEDNLQWLELTSVSLGQFPRNALRNLVNLEQSLDLSDNGISGFEREDFSYFTKLRSLSLSGNDLPNAIQSGALLQLPSTLKSLHLARGGLNTVPTEVITANPQIEFLVLSDNNIASLESDNFPETNNLEMLDLSGNPISVIEPEYFQALTRIRSLRIEQSALTAIDFSVFDGLSALAHLDFDNNPLLERVGVSSIEKVPATITIIDLANTGIEYIDPKIDTILDKPFSAIWFHNNTKLICDENVHWMAKRAFCPTGGYEPLLGIGGSECANLDGTSLESYLKESVPDPCLETIEPEEQIHGNEANQIPGEPYIWQGSCGVPSSALFYRFEPSSPKYIALSNPWLISVRQPHRPWQVSKPSPNHWAVAALIRAKPGTEESDVAITSANKCEFIMDGLDIAVFGAEDSEKDGILTVPIAACHRHPDYDDGRLFFCISFCLVLFSALSAASCLIRIRDRHTSLAVQVLLCACISLLYGAISRTSFITGSFFIHFLTLRWTAIFGTADPNDIAILKLQMPVKFTDRIKPICLPDPTENTVANTKAILAGWGPVNAPHSNELRQVALRVIDSDRCNTLYPGHADDVFCVGGYENETAGYCNRDVGGPIVTKRRGQRVMSGIAINNELSPSPRFPRLITRVAHHVSSGWIEKTIKEKSALWEEAAK